MKLISYKENKNIKLGAFEEGKIYDLYAIDSNIADNMLKFLQANIIFQMILYLFQRL